jgi:hypothetical protein
MHTYQITFFKTVVNSQGHEQKITQRVMPICSASCAEAVRDAVRAFEQAEDISDWRVHADSLEVAAG